MVVGSASRFWFLFWQKQQRIISLYKTVAGRARRKLFTVHWKLFTTTENARLNIETSVKNHIRGTTQFAVLLLPLSGSIYHWDHHGTIASWWQTYESLCLYAAITGSIYSAYTRVSLFGLPAQKGWVLRSTLSARTCRRLSVKVQPWPSSSQPLSIV